MTETSPFLWIETGFPLNGLIYINGVVAGYNGSVIYASRDGINWDAYDTGVTLQYVFPHGGKLYFSFVNEASHSDYGCFNPMDDTIRTFAGHSHRVYSSGGWNSEHMPDPPYDFTAHSSPYFIVTDTNLLITVPSRYIGSPSPHGVELIGFFIDINVLTNEVVRHQSAEGGVNSPVHGHEYISHVGYMNKFVRIMDNYYTNSMYIQNRAYLLKRSALDNKMWGVVGNYDEYGFYPNYQDARDIAAGPNNKLLFTEAILGGIVLEEVSPLDGTSISEYVIRMFSNTSVKYGGSACYGNGYFLAISGTKCLYSKANSLTAITTPWNEDTIPVSSTKIVSLGNRVFVIDGGAIGILADPRTERVIPRVSLKGIYLSRHSSLFTGYYGILLREQLKGSTTSEMPSKITLEDEVTLIVYVPVSVSKTSVITPDSVTFTTTVQTATSLQWQQSADNELWADITGETDATYTASFTSADAGTKYYRCKASNGAYTAYSDIITLIVSLPPEPPVKVISFTASATSVASPGSITFSVVADYANTYEWKRCWGNPNHSDEWEVIPGATGSTYTETFPALFDGTAYYYCFAKNGADSDRTDIITVRVAPEPTVTVTPTSSSVIAPDSVILRATAEHTDRYQWQQSADTDLWTDIEGAIWSNYTGSFTIQDVGIKYYRCKVTNSSRTAYSETITVTVLEPTAPTVTVSPSTTTVSVSNSVTLTAAAQHATGYQWQQSADNDLWTDITGATNSTYTTSFTTADVGTKYYRCKVTGKGGTAYSESVSVIVAPPSENDPAISIAVTSVIPDEYGYQLVGDVNLQATYTGSPTLSWEQAYQWCDPADVEDYFGEENVTTATFTISDMTLTNFDAFRMVRCKATYAGSVLISNVLYLCSVCDTGSSAGLVGVGATMDEATADLQKKIG
ncbi:MAG TPA: hypothetical protein O0Y06_06385 [Methanocorpusculum sp.]|nr:hypothetical protein [Methanocorpusculum sp.]HJK80512.1 hypothetical protein [Methanocorpusculum sp.]